MLYFTMIIYNHSDKQFESFHDKRITVVMFYKRIEHYFIKNFKTNNDKTIYFYFTIKSGQ
jgi:hypothetical protein